MRCPSRERAGFRVAHGAWSQVEYESARRLDARAQPLPLGVTGNTPDSGSGESWFEPRRGNSKRDAALVRCRASSFSGVTSTFQVFTPTPLLNLNPTTSQYAGRATWPADS